MRPFLTFDLADECKALPWRNLADDQK